MRADIPTIGEGPQTLAEIINELRRVERESRAYWSRFSTAEFFAPLAADAWSPADHVRHLTKSIRPVTSGLKVPKFAIRLLFGTHRAPSRSFSAMRADYRAALVTGVSAGRFAPRPVGATEQDEATRQQCLVRQGVAVDDLLAATGHWRDDASDTCRMPHPALGKLTVREMLFFTLYHNLHHVHVAERRRNPTAVD